MSIAQALDAHRNNAKQLIQSGMVTDQQGLARAELANQNNLEMRRQDLAAQQAAENNASERRAQNLSFAQSLAKPAPSASRLGGLETLLGDVGLQSSLSPGMIAAGNTGMATVGARQNEWTQPNAYATGGLIDGPPPPPDGSDNVDIKAKSGEYVLPPEAVQLLGLETLDRIVTMATGQPPVHGGVPTEEGKAGFAQGGNVSPIEWSRQQNRKHQQQISDTGTGMLGDPSRAFGQTTSAAPQAPATRQGPSTEAIAKGQQLRNNSALRFMDNAFPQTMAAADKLNSAVSAAPSAGIVVHEAATRAPGVLWSAAKDVFGPVARDTGRFFQEAWTGQPQSALPSQAPTPRPAANLDTLRNDPSALRTLALLPATAGGLQAFAEQRGPRAQQAIARATADGPGDTVTATGITGQDSAGKTQRVYKNEFQPGSDDYRQYGRAIYSDSFRGATKGGFDADFAKSGNYVGDPETGQGVSLPATDGKGARMGLGDLTPQETSAMMNAYTPARQAGLRAIQDDTNLKLMRQWQGRDIGRAPEEVRELYGKPPSLETTVTRNLQQALSPEGQAQRQQQEMGLAAVKAAGQMAGKQKAAPSAAKQQKEWLDTYFATPEGDAPEQTAQRAWAASTANRVLRKAPIAPEVLYPVLAEAALLTPLEDEAPEAFEARRKMTIARTLNVKPEALFDNWAAAPSAGAGGR